VFGAVVLKVSIIEWISGPEQLSSAGDRSDVACVRFNIENDSAMRVYVCLSAILDFRVSGTIDFLRLRCTNKQNRQTKVSKPAVFISASLESVSEHL
jgi:hypothetical protein